MAQTNPQDGGAALSPAGTMVGLCKPTFNPSPCANPIASEAVGAAMQAGVVSASRNNMAALAAAKTRPSPAENAYMSPTSLTPGGPAPPPVGAAMSQSRPSMPIAPTPTGASPYPTAPNPAGLQQQQAPRPEDNLSITQQLERMGGPIQMKHNMRKMTFSMTHGGTLTGLKSQKMKPGSQFAVHSPEHGERAVVTAVRITSIDSSCPQQIGVLFDDLPAKFRNSKPDKERGLEYHARCPRAGLPADNTAKEVFRLHEMVRPELLLAYGGIKSIDDVKAEVETTSTGLGTVYLEGTVLGGIIKKNNPRGVMVQKADDGRFFVQMKASKIGEYIAEVDKLLQDPNFQRCLTDLSNFNMTLVPLNKSGDWEDVDEWKTLTGAERERANQSLKTPFTVNVEGEMDVMILKK